MARRDDHHPYEALADPVRRGILDLLRKGGSRTAGDIAEQFHVSKPTLSHHLGVLRSAGLVRSERRGTNVVYTLQTNVFEELAADLLALAGATVLSIRRMRLARAPGSTAALGGAGLGKKRKVRS